MRLFDYMQKISDNNFHWKHVCKQKKLLFSSYRYLFVGKRGLETKISQDRLKFAFNLLCMNSLCIHPVRNMLRVKKNHIFLCRLCHMAQKFALIFRINFLRVNRLIFLPYFSKKVDCSNNQYWAELNDSIYSVLIDFSKRQHKPTAKLFIYLLKPTLLSPIFLRMAEFIA
jgi:hypothetical protein